MDAYAQVVQRIFGETRAPGNANNERAYALIADARAAGCSRCGESELAKCDPLCANCHRKEHAIRP